MARLAEYHGARQPEPGRCISNPLAVVLSASPSCPRVESPVQCGCGMVGGLLVGVEATASVATRKMQEERGVKLGEEKEMGS